GLDQPRVELLALDRDLLEVRLQLLRATLGRFELAAIAFEALASLLAAGLGERRNGEHDQDCAGKRRPRRWAACAGCARCVAQPVGHCRPVLALGDRQCRPSESAGRECRISLPQITAIMAWVSCGCWCGFARHATGEPAWAPAPMARAALR